MFEHRIPPGNEILRGRRGQIEVELIPQKPGKFRYEITVETDRNSTN